MSTGFCMNTGRCNDAIGCAYRKNEGLFTDLELMTQIKFGARILLISLTTTKGSGINSNFWMKSGAAKMLPRK